MQLATKFKYSSPSLRSREPLSDDQLRSVAPSIFANAAHTSRSERYTYIPTSTVLGGLRKEGFQPFMVTQARVRDEGKREHTKHMVRMRHASQIEDAEAAEVVLINSHDGTSAYQMIGGMFRFVCSNGLVCGDTLGEVRVPHKGKIVDQVIEGAYDILDGFDLVRERRDEMRGTSLAPGEAQALARAALTLKYEPDPLRPAPITEAQLLQPRRAADTSQDLWTVFNAVQENVVAGGLRARASNGRRLTTRPVVGIDQNLKLNRALWTLAEEMRRLKSSS